MDFSKFLFYCSDISLLISEPRSNRRPLITQKYEGIISKLPDNRTSAELKYIEDLDNKISNFKPEISNSFKTNVTTIYSVEVFNRGVLHEKEGLQSVHKGLAAESEAIKMASDALSIDLKKNYELFSNEYFKGRPDCVVNQKKKKKRKVYDIKCPVDMPSFIRQVTDEVDKVINCQMQGYMDITNTDEAGVIFCLVNMPQQVIDMARRRIIAKGREFDYPEEIVEMRIAQMERNMMYDDIPIEMRVFDFTVQRDENTIEYAKEKAELAREYLSVLHNRFWRKNQ